LNYSTIYEAGFFDAVVHRETQHPMYKLDVVVVELRAKMSLNL
jgi:hypothetical protein